MKSVPKAAPEFVTRLPFSVDGRISLVSITPHWMQEKSANTMCCTITCHEGGFRIVLKEQAAV